MTKCKLTSRTAGFSLIELMVTISIIVLLSTISMVVYRQASLNARDSKRKADLETVRQALVLYKTELGTYPVRTTENQASFTAVLGTLSDANYLGNTSTLIDPKGSTDPYGYRYYSDGTVFTVCVELETDGVPSTTDYCTTQP